MNHCRDCAAFVRKIDHAKDYKGDDTIVETLFGECRRHAPVVLGTPRQGMTQSQGWWPVTRENDGCCQWQNMNSDYAKVYLDDGWILQARDT